MSDRAQGDKSQHKMEGDEIIVQQTGESTGDPTNPDTILVHQVQDEMGNLSASVEGSNQEVVQIVMQQNGGNNQMVMPDGQMLQLDSGSDEVQYIQMTNENGESQLIQITPDGQAHYVQILGNEQEGQQISSLEAETPMSVQQEQNQDDTSTNQSVDDTPQLITTEALANDSEDNSSIMVIKNENNDTVLNVDMAALDGAISVDEGNIEGTIEEQDQAQVSVTTFTEGEPQITLSSQDSSTPSVSSPALVSPTPASPPPTKKIKKEASPAKPATLDVNNPIALDSETVVMIKGRRCALRVDPNTSQLMAYPIRPPGSTGRKRGRPRKQPRDPNAPPPPSLKLKPKLPPVQMSEKENSAAEGLLGLSEVGPDGTRKSRRAKKRPRTMEEYETGAIEGVEEPPDIDHNEEDVEVKIPPALLSKNADEIEGTGDEREETQTVLVTEDGQIIETPRPFKPPKEKEPDVVITAAKKPRTKVNPTINQLQNYLANLGLPVKRGRGRPRRTPLPGATSTNPIPAFIIPSPDGQAVMMAPVQGLNITPQGDTTRKMPTLLPKPPVGQVSTTLEQNPPIVIDNMDGTQTFVIEQAGKVIGAAGEDASMQAADTSVLAQQQQQVITIDTDGSEPRIISLGPADASQDLVIKLGEGAETEAQVIEIGEDEAKQLVGLEGSTVELLSQPDSTVMQFTQKTDAATSEAIVQNGGGQIMIVPQPDGADMSGQRVEEVEVGGEVVEEQDTEVNDAVAQLQAEEAGQHSAGDEEEEDITDSITDSPMKPEATLKLALDNKSSPSKMPPPAIIQLPQHLVPLLVQPKKEPAKIGLKTAEQDLAKMKCPRCDYQAYYQHQFQNHLQTHHTDDIEKCKCCSYLTFSKEDLEEHFREAHPKCICPHCGYTAEHAYIIKRHMMRHNPKGCECDICGKTYKDVYILKMHIKMVHMPAEVLFECNLCQKKFTRKAHLKRHLRIHEPEKPFKCPHCEYRGCERSDITKHLLIHEDPKHTCEVCGKSFRHIKNKELHLKRHRGQRDYKCGVCDFYGYTFTDIRKHIERKHADRTATICDKCGSAFKSESQLKSHREKQCALLLMEQQLAEVEETGGLTITQTQLTGGGTGPDALSQVTVQQVFSDAGAGADVVNVNLESGDFSEAQMSEAQYVEQIGDQYSSVTDASHMITSSQLLTSTSSSATIAITDTGQIIDTATIINASHDDGEEEEEAQVLAVGDLEGQEMEDMAAGIEMAYVTTEERDNNIKYENTDSMVVTMS